MSFRRSPFQFNSDLNPDERRSELLRRFGFQPEEDNMFYETTPPPPPSWSEWSGRFHRPGFYEDPEWRNTGSVFGNSGSGPSSPQSRMRPGWTTGSASEPEEGVPIKVVHEQSGGRGFDDCDGVSEASSHSSASSTRSVPSSNGSKGRHEPRVHHIPIMVEPRNGPTSSSYGSAPINGEPKQPSTHFSPQVSRRGCGSSKDVDSPDTRNVTTIPVRMESGDEAQPQFPEDPKPAEKDNWSNTYPRQKCQQVPKSPPQSPSSCKSPSSSTRSPETTSPPRSGHSSNQASSPEEQIRRINMELADLSQQVSKFNGKVGDKQFRFLDEMLTRLMLKLDLIDPAGQEEIRKMRKLAIHDVQMVINRLEGKPPETSTALVELEPREAEPVSNNEFQSFDENASANSQSACYLGGPFGGMEAASPPPPPAKDTPMDTECQPLTAMAVIASDSEMAPAGNGPMEDLQADVSDLPRPIDVDLSCPSAANLAEASSDAGTPLNEHGLPTRQEMSETAEKSNSGTSIADPLTSTDL
ncbi:unnamed protein product [Ixodes hexagonus]